MTEGKADVDEECSKKDPLAAHQDVLSGHTPACLQPLAEAEAREANRLVPTDGGVGGVVERGVLLVFVSVVSILGVQLFKLNKQVNKETKKKKKKKKKEKEETNKRKESKEKDTCIAHT